MYFLVKCKQTLTFCNANFRAKSLRPDIFNKLGRVYLPFTFFESVGMKWFGRRIVVRFFKLNAFSSKAMIMGLHGRSSDLFLLQAPSRYGCPVQWLEVVAWSLCLKLTAAGLFRICTWFPFNCFHRRMKTNRCTAKIEKFLDMNEQAAYIFMRSVLVGRLLCWMPRYGVPLVIVCLWPRWRWIPVRRLGCSWPR